MLGNVEDKMAQAKSQGISKRSNDQLGSLSQRYSTTGNLCYKHIYQQFSSQLYFSFLCLLFEYFWRTIKTYLHLNPHIKLVYQFWNSNHFWKTKLEKLVKITTATWSICVFQVLQFSISWHHSDLWLPTWLDRHCGRHLSTRRMVRKLMLQERRPFKTHW